MDLLELFNNCAYRIHYQEIGHGVNYAFVEDRETLYIYFQGSNQIMDWWRNFLFPAKPYKDMEIPYKVHRGFLEAWKEVEDVIIEKITETVFKKIGEETFQEQFRWKHIVIVGYSHGGALAGFCHECVWFWRPDLRESGLEGYGFEAPRFYGGYFVKKALKQRWKNFTVIRCNSDIVTHMPPWIFGFTHVGKILKIKGDTSLVDKWYIPKCIKSHFPQVVADGLKKL